MDAIKAEKLVKKYKDHPAVDHISFTVKEGEFFAFLGENGAGKSTTINMLCTILDKTEGKVTILGNELGKNDDAIRKDTGIVFQNSVMDGKLTVKENLYTRGSYYGLSKKEINKALEPFMSSLELKDVWNQKYEKLSGGQRRRVDIVRALLHSPKILFLDEPTTGLDPLSRKLVWDYIASLRKEKHMTIFLTTHYMEEVKDADHVVILDKGKIVADDTPASLKNKYTHTKLFWYARRSEVNDRILKNLKFTYEGNHYAVMVPSESKKKADLTENETLLGRNKDICLTDFLYEHKDDMTDYEIIKGSMDDVFLNLTGRKMGD